MVSVAYLNFEINITNVGKKVETFRNICDVVCDYNQAKQKFSCELEVCQDISEYGVKSTRIKRKDVGRITTFEMDTNNTGEDLNFHKADPSNAMVCSFSHTSKLLTCE